MDFGRRTSHLSASLRRHERDSAAWAPRTVLCSPVLDSVARSFVRAPRMLRRRCVNRQPNRLRLRPPRAGLVDQVSGNPGAPLLVSVPKWCADSCRAVKCARTSRMSWSVWAVGSTFANGMLSAPLP